MFIPMHDLPFLTFQQHNIYNIMYEHVNACIKHLKQENPNLTS